MLCAGHPAVKARRPLASDAPARPELGLYPGDLDVGEHASATERIVGDEGLGGFAVGHVEHEELPKAVGGVIGDERTRYDDGPGVHVDVVTVLVEGCLPARSRTTNVPADHCEVHRLRP